ncbi:hypothetical protein Glove_46g141 [Diversispora epigaea]|uniref:Uncharacterized protein n=1 Tax=Diversispora epigaea TaxID=1348612 RepID=A0A397JHU9_9GLOM|nr:hypothetical protein Glove_46g141 [Diversispora epigaea]
MSSIMLEDILIEKREAAFLQLRPLCVSLLNSVTVSKEKVQEVIQTTNKLHLTLKSIPDVSAVLDYNLIQYILVPLLKLYSSLQNSDRFLEEFLNCIRFLLSTSWHNYMMPEQFKQLLVLLVRLIGGSVSPKTKENQNTPEFSISEETKLAGVKCILELLPKQPEHYNEIPNSDNFQLPIRNELLLTEIQEIHLRAVVGRCVYVLLEIISTERHLQLRLTSIETLQQLVKCIENPGIVAAFLPGILSTLSKVMIRDQKENHLLLVKIVEALMNIIYSVMNDKINKDLFSKTNSLSDLKDVWINSESSRNHDPSSKTNITSNNISQSPGSIYVERTKSWLKATKAQIKILIGSIFTIRNHPSWQLRLEFVKFSFKLLFYCTNSLDTCTPILIETLVFYLNDDHEQVSNLCREHLEVIRENSNFGEILIPILKENLNTWLTSLPRYLIGLDENAKYNASSLIVGFVYLLGSEVQTVLNNLLERVSDGLLNALEFYVENIHIIEDRLLIGQYENLTEENENLQLQKFSRPQFKHIHEQRVTSTILTIFRLLGYFGNIEFLIDHFLTYIRNPDSERFHAQCIFIINEILLGASGVDINSDFNLVKMVPTNSIQEVKRISKYVLKEYIEIELTPRTSKKSKLKEKSLIKSNKHQIIEFVDESLPNMNIESQNRSILSNCFILEGIAYISRVMAMEFRTELNESLYPILEKVGQVNSRIHNTADITLHHISVWCGYSSKKALILENIDYLINVASRKLNHIQLNPQTPLMLTAMIMIVGPPVLPYLDDSIEEIFDALDHHHMNSNLLSSLALVLYSVVRIISDSCEREQIDKNVDKYIENNNNNVSSTKNHNTGLSEEIAEFIENFSLKKTGTNVQEERATLEEIEQYFLEHHRSKEKSESQEPQDELDNIEDIIKGEKGEDEEDEGDENTSDKKPKPTQLQSTCLKIIDKVLPFLSSSSSRIRILILDMMRLSLPVLQSIPHELYPLINRIWPLVVNRLKDKEQIVNLGATRLIQSIASTSGDFFASRVVDDMWPTFQELLSQQVTRDQEFLNYEFSQSHLIKKSILETMKVVIHRVSLSDQILSEIINTMYPFLSKEIHEDHQNSAIELFKELIYRNSNNTWLVLRGLDENCATIINNNINNNNEVDISNMLEDIVWPKHLCRYPEGDKKDQYSRNVQILLDEIDKIDKMA